MFWEDAERTANYAHNREPHQGIENKIPYNVLYNKSVNYNNLHVFGYKVYYLDDNNKENFEKKSRQGIFSRI